MWSSGGGGGAAAPLLLYSIRKHPASVYILMNALNRHTFYILDPTANREIVVSLSSSIKEFAVSVKSETCYNGNLAVLLIVQQSVQSVVQLSAAYVFVYIVRTIQNKTLFIFHLSNKSEAR